jgi:hypothetical protein
LFIYGRSDHEDTRAQAVRIMSTQCSNNNIVCQQQLRALGGAAGMIAPLKKYVSTRAALVGRKAGVKFDLVSSVVSEEPYQDPLDNPYGGEISILIIALLDGITNMFLGNELNESSFADQDGIDALLELLEVAPFVLRIKILRLLSDLFLNRLLVTYANAWRSPKTLRSAAQLLCHCWLDEEARLDCERKERGIICDIWNPLGNHNWPVDNSVPPAAPLGSTASLATSSGFLFDAEGSTAVASMTLNNNNNKSLIATKLATAILASRNTSQSNLPVEVCNQVLERDTRGIISASLRSLGVYHLYGILDPRNPVKLIEESLEGGIVYSESKVRDNSQVLLPGSPTSAGGSHVFGSSPDVVTIGRAGIGAVSGGLSGSQLLGGEGGTPAAGLTGSNTRATTSIGPSGDLGLNHRDKQVLSLAHKYPALREGQWWQVFVRQALENSPGGVINPIEADRAMMDACLEMYFDAAQAVQLEQMALHEEGEGVKKDGESDFIGQIITKKNQQIKAEWLKRYGKNRAKK